MKKHITTGLIYLFISIILSTLAISEVLPSEVLLLYDILSQGMIIGMKILFLSNFFWQSNYRNNFLS